MQIGPTRTLFYRGILRFYRRVSQRVFRARFGPCKRAPTKAAPALPPNHFFLIWCSRTFAMARFSSDVACLRGTAHAGMLGAWLPILYITDNHSTTSRSDSARWPFTSVTVSTPKPARSVAPHHAGERLRAALRPLGLGDCQASRIAGCGCVSWRTPVWDRTAPRGGGQPAGPARTPGSAACCRSASTPIATGTNRFVSSSNAITSAVSLGHDESLIVFLGEDDERQYLYPPEFHRGFFRLAVGLEDTDDLIRDIGHALVEAGFEV